MTLTDLTVKSQTTEQLRMLILGAPGSGKTTSALTFPNPLVIDFDRNCPPGVETIPMWNPDFVNKICTPINKRPNRRDALKRILRGVTFPPCTLLLDTWTMLQNEFDLCADADPAPYLTKQGEVDGFKIFKHKLLYSAEVCELLKGLSCDVIVLAHEQIDRGEDGKPNGKLKPLMSGQFQDQMAGHFTDVIRAVVRRDKTTGKVTYDWQIRSDDVFNAKCRFIQPADKYIPQGFESYRKYKVPILSSLGPS